MKKAFTIISLFVAMMLSGTARAQFFRVRELPKQEVALNFACGLLPDSHLNSCPTVKHSGMGKKSFCDTDEYMSFNALYLRNFGNRFGAGVQVGYGFMYSDDEGTNVVFTNHHYYSDYKSDGKNCVARVKETSFFVMPTMRWYWLNHSHFGMYSRVAAGLDLRHVRETDLNPHDDLDFKCGTETSAKVAYQISLFGFEWGGDLIRGYMEWGYGNQGFVCWGVKSTF